VTPAKAVTSRGRTVKRVVGFFLIFAVLCFAPGCSDSKNKSGTEVKSATPPPGPNEKSKGAKPIAPKGVE